MLCRPAVVDRLCLSCWCSFAELRQLEFRSPDTPHVIFDSLIAIALDCSRSNSNRRPRRQALVDRMRSAIASHSAEAEGSEKAARNFLVLTPDCCGTMTAPMVATHSLMLA